jgi:type IV pilus assembly protein PilW
VSSRRVSIRRTQFGLTMIELMVSIVIGLVVIGAMSYAYLGSKGAYRGNESLGRIQEAGRFALDAIARDVRRAGALGCGSFTSITNQPVTPSVLVPKGGSGDPTVLTVDPNSGNPMPVQGFVPSQYTQPVTQPTTWVLPSKGTRPATSAPSYWGGDILQLQIASGLPARMSAVVDPVNANITIADNTLPNSAAVNNFNPADYALLADCSSAAVFQITGASTATQPAVLSYLPPSGPTPALPASITLNTFPTVQHFDQVTYYVGQVPGNAAAPAQATALYRYSMSSGTVEEVVDNVEDMDVVYGIDTTPNDNVFSADTFVHAGGVPDWTQVVSIRVSLTAVGDQFGVAPTAQTLSLHGTATVAPDTRLRQVFSATAALRDRLQ